MQKIVINGRFLTQPVTGVQRYARELLDGLDSILDFRSDLEVILLTPKLEGLVPTLRNIKHRVVGKFSGHLWEQLCLPRYLNGAILFCPGNTAPVVSLLGRTKVVVTVHDLSYLYFPEAYSAKFKFLYKLLIPLVLRKADFVITVSNSEKAAILKNYPFTDGKLFAVQNGGFSESVKHQIGFTLENNYTTILYVGSLTKRKNFPGMLEVAIRLAKRRGFRFVFVGSIPDGLVESTKAIPDYVYDKIKFLGQVNDLNQLLVHYKSATCFFFPSFYEASPLPPIEAMACGCPVLTSKIPSLLERCEDAAFYCDPYNIDEIENGLEMLVDDKKLQEKLRKSGYLQATKYSWTNCARITLEYILK